MRILYLTLLTIILSISLHSAYGQGHTFLTLDTDKTQYLVGDTIYVSGKTNNISFGEEINLMVVAPGGNIVSMEKLIVDSKKKFQNSIITTTSSIKSSGTYTLLAMLENENVIAETRFTIKTSPVIPILDTSQPNVLLNFDFQNTNNQNIQEHVDYKITVLKNNVKVYVSDSLTHSSTGKVSIPMQLVEGKVYDVLIEVRGILFRSISAETSSFSILKENENIHSQLTSEKGLRINLAVNKDPSLEPKIIPEWIKKNAKWWSNGDIDDYSFVQGIQYLIKEKIVSIPKLPYPSSWMDDSVPSWVKNNAKWWADDLIPEDEFIKGIKYLVEKGIVRI